MISKQKKLLYALALVLTSTLFGLELVQATNRADLPEPLELPAEAKFEDSQLSSASEQGLVAASSSSAPTASDSSSQPVGAALESLETTLARLGGSSDSTRKLAQLERVRRKRELAEEVEPQARREADEQDAAPLVVTPSDLGAQRREAYPKRLERLELFLEREPLIGVVQGASGSAAMFGGRVVRVGDTLLVDDARVLACDERGVSLELDGRPLWIALPPLRPRARAAPSGGGGPEPLVQPAAPIPAASPQPAVQGGA